MKEEGMEEGRTINNEHEGRKLTSGRANKNQSITKKTDERRTEAQKEENNRVFLSEDQVGRPGCTGPQSGPHQSFRERIRK